MVAALNKNLLGDFVAFTKECPELRLGSRRVKALEQENEETSTSTWRLVDWAAKGASVACGFAGSLADQEMAAESARSEK